MNNYIKLTQILIILFSFSFTTSCVNYQENIPNNNFSITNFDLKQLDKEGNPHFNLTSTKATIDPLTNNIDANDVIITIPGTKSLFNKISASKALIDKVNNELYLIENVKLEGFKEKNSILYANSIKWIINKQKIIIEGNIKLNYINTFITSSKAVYNEKTEDIIFTGITKYTLYKDNEKRLPLINLKADYAKIDNNSKTIEFASTNSQVESTVNIDIE